MFRGSQYAEKIEYIRYTPGKSFIENPSYGNSHVENDIRFYIDSTNEVSPNDWYNAYFEVQFKINKKANNTDFVAADISSLAGDAYSLINKIYINFNGANITSLTEINQYVNALNMLQFSDSYINGPGTQSFTYPRINLIARPLGADNEFLKEKRSD